MCWKIHAGIYIMRMMNDRSWRVWMRMSGECVHYVILYWYFCVVFAFVRERKRERILRGSVKVRTHVCMRDSSGTCGPSSSRVGAKWRKAKKKLKGTLSLWCGLKLPFNFWIQIVCESFFSYTYLHINR